MFGLSVEWTWTILMLSVIPLETLLGALVLWGAWRLAYRQEREQLLKQDRIKKDKYDRWCIDERGRIGKLLAKALEPSTHPNSTFDCVVTKNDNGICSITVKHKINCICSSWPIILQIDVSLGGWAGEGIRVAYGPSGREVRYYADVRSVEYLASMLPHHIHTYTAQRAA